jgi:hypothetical protein
LSIENRNISRPTEGIYASGRAGSAVRKNKKQGRGFFLTLLILSGIVILFLAAFSFKGREIHIFTFQKFVINKAFVSLLPREYTLEEAEGVRKKVYNFYEAAYDRGISDRALYEVSNRIQTIMGDERITPEEIQGLLLLIDEKAGPA